MKLVWTLLVASVAMAADSLGDWYGALQLPGMNLRVTFHLTRDGDAVKGTLDSIDQGAMGIPLAVKVEGNKITADAAQVKGKFEGEVNEDATKVKGTWTQAGRPLPLELTREKHVIKEIAAVPMTPAERDFLISHLEKSRAEFLASIQGVTPEQWKFKSAPDRWSIGDCAEHLVTTEDALFGMVTKQLLKIPAREGKRMGQAEDEKVIARITDRSWKAKAPEILIPSGKYTTPETVRDAFNPKRDNSIQWIKSTQEDLRSRVSGQMDAYQYLVMMSAHTLRHTAQLNEVKADPKYPK